MKKSLAPPEPKVPPSQLVLARALARELESGTDLDDCYIKISNRFGVSISYLALVWTLKTKGIINV